MARLKLASLEKLTDFVRLCLWTGWVKNARPQSVVLVGEPGTGKTTLLERFHGNAWIDYYSDITLVQFLAVMKRVKEGYVRFMILTEFSSILSRRRAVSQNFLSKLGQAMAEGLGRVAYGPVDKDFGGARIGMLAAVTPTMLQRNWFVLSDIGLESRAFFLDASSTTHEERVLEKMALNGNQRYISTIGLEMPRDSVRVDCAPRYAAVMMKWTDEMRRTRTAHVWGPRTVLRLRGLVLAHALSMGRDAVRQSDVEAVYRFREYWLKPAIPRKVVQDDD